MDIERLKELADCDVFIGGNPIVADRAQETLRTLIDEAVSKTERAEPCEWCEIASVCEYEVTILKDDDRWATTRIFMPNYCPNCGRRLED